MRDEYSIEQRATQNFDTRTKEYFSEVLSCYAAASTALRLWCSGHLQFVTFCSNCRILSNSTVMRRPRTSCPSSASSKKTTSDHQYGKRYDYADWRFSELVRPLLKYYDTADCHELIEGIHGNGQTWERGRAYTDHRDLRSRLLKLDPAADFD